LERTAFERSICAYAGLVQLGRMLVALTCTNENCSIREPSTRTKYTYDQIGNLLSKATPFGTINHGLDRLYGAGYGTGRLLEISTSVNDGDRFDYGYD